MQAGIKGFVALGVLALLGAGIAQADSMTWDVATVHGQNEFTISPDGTSLLYHEQGWTDYVWYQNNGSPEGTIAQGMYGDRTGMRTFAMTDVAYGQTLDNLILSFEYHNTLGGYPTINFFLTDGLGHYGIFAPTSSGIGAVSVIDPINGWSRITLDFTNVTTTANMAVYEHNGLSTTYGDPFTNFQWADIQDLTIAGVYDYQRSPTGGWDAWGTMFDANHGLALIWGDTVNSNNSYGSQMREIANLTLSVGGTQYTGTFENAQAPVPEPATITVLGLGLGGLALSRLRKRLG
ncbi:MAG: PEP-CTERM sorting domain-containing protein [Candidatus Hydrogenedentes bacterium]|nr:PEP-CTERM sorting domain-containing protein [Candidatus Hydrogenedentota bacterium]